MVFSSVSFLLFLPPIVLIYFLVPRKLKTLWLLAASYYFCFCWGSVCCLYLGVITLITYGAGLLLDKEKENPKAVKTLLFIFSIFFVSAALLFVKYFNFSILNINYLFAFLHIPFSLPTRTIFVPIGISFYTFQAVGYLIDIKREKITAEKNILFFSLFMSFFPQQISGPIARADALLPQLKKRSSFNFDKVRQGLMLMGFGFFQKVVIADKVALVANQVFNGYAQYEGFQIIIGTLAFTVQIYFDFAGYTDIARGIAKIFSLDLQKNFNRPYTSKSIAEFWHRWHISLSLWFRDYIYIPLGGNRKGKLRKYLNVVIVFLVSGVWHGAAWHFVFWGLLHGFYQVVGEATKPLRQSVVKYFKLDLYPKLHGAVQIVITFFLVNLAWIFFRANNLTESVEIVKRMFVHNVWVLTSGSIFSIGLSHQQFTLLFIAIVISAFMNYARTKTDLYIIIASQPLLLRWLLYFGLIFVILIFGSYGVGYNAGQFIYANF